MRITRARGLVLKRGECLVGVAPRAGKALSAPADPARHWEVPIREVAPADVLKLLRKAEKAGPRVAIVARPTRSSVFEHAIVPRLPVQRAIKKPPVMHVVAHFAVTLGKLLAGLKA